MHYNTAMSLSLHASVIMRVPGAIKGNTFRETSTTTAYIHHLTNEYFTFTQPLTMDYQF